MAPYQWLMLASIRIPVYAHHDSVYRLSRDKEFLALRIEFFQQLYEKMGCGEQGERQVQKLKSAVMMNEKNKIQTEIIPLQEFDSMIGLQVIETPGHAPDHIVFLDQKRRWLFGGDHLIRHISSNALVGPDKNGKRIFSLVQYERSLAKCLSLDMETVFPGHGDIIQNPKELITKRLKKSPEKAERIRESIRSGITIPSSIAQSFYKEKYQSQFSLVMSEIIGHLDFLEYHNKVGKELIHGVWHYHIT
jgi:glyoxylase-like metal-dependent hydrolase (beta-lactamase superfamily II)